MFEKTDETLGTNTCNVHVQLLQHMQHHDLLLQHPHETLATCIETPETLETYAYNMCGATL
jgi:hypothetical protein